MPAVHVVEGLVIAGSMSRASELHHTVGMCGIGTLPSPLRLGESGMAEGLAVSPAFCSLGQLGRISVPRA